MIYSLNGTLSHIEPNIAVIECSGVGYKCIVSMNTQKKLGHVGDKVKIYTFLNTTREGSIELFGFALESELNCFKMLTSVSGVGPKFAVSLLSGLTPEQIAIAVAANDIKTLTRAQGVGKKIAERIILELRDKLNCITTDSLTEGSTCMAPLTSSTNEAINALTMLGYSASDAMSVVSKIDSSLPIEEIIRLSLKSIAKEM